MLNTARQVGGATGVAIFGALVASGSNAEITSGVHSVMGISTALLLVAAATGFWSRSGLSQLANAA